MDAAVGASGKRIDFHVHAKVSKRLPFSFEYFQWNLLQAKHAGLDAFVLTEHFHAPDFWGMYDHLRRHFAYADGVFQVDDRLRILTGAELGMAERCDILLLGTLDQLGRLSLGLASSPTTGYKPPFVEARAVARRCGILMIGAHMFRSGKELAHLGTANLRQLDALESNGKDFFHDTMIREEADRLELPVIGGSDAHYWLQVGIKSAILPVGEVTHATVTRAMAARQTRVRSLPYGPLAVQVSRTYKRMLKAQSAPVS